MKKYTTIRLLTVCVASGLLVGVPAMADEPAAAGAGSAAAAEASPAEQAEAAPQSDDQPSDDQSANDPSAADKSSSGTSVSVTVDGHASGARAGSGKVFSGRLVIIGPDGKRREFDLTKELPDDVRVLIGPEGSQDGKGRAFSFSFSDGQARISANTGKRSIIIEKGHPQKHAPDHPGQADDGQAAEQSEAEPVERLMLGVHCREADEVLRGQLKLGQKGLVVMEVVDESPAAAAGLQTGDLLLQAGDLELVTVQTLLEVVQQTGEQDLEIKLLRQGDELQLKVRPRLMKVPQRLVISVGGDKEHDVLKKWMGEGRLPKELEEQLKSQRAHIRLRHIHPGLVIEKNMSPEDIQRLVDDAMRAAQEKAQPEPAEQAPEAAEAESLEKVRSELDALQQQLKLLTERLAELEKGE